MVGGNPLLVNVVELRRVVGNRRTIDTDVELADLALPSVRVAAGSTLHLALELESMSGGVDVRGTLGGTWDGECRRCLEPVAGELLVTVDEVFEDNPTEGETYPVDGDTIDLEPMVRELALLGLPINPLCRDDCAGPDPERLPVTVESDEAGEPTPDPRWAALDALKGELS